MKKPLIIILSIIGVLLLIGIGIFIYFKNTYLSKDEIREIVMKAAGESSDKIHIYKIELDIEENLYEVDFYYFNQDVEYKYKINAKTGKIIYNNFNSSTQNQDVQNNNTNSTNTNNSTKEITLDEAKKRALENANINLEKNNVTFTETKTDYEHGQKIYEIEFIYNYHEYNYEINATTGEIISYEKDHQ